MVPDSWFRYRDPARRRLHPRPRARSAASPSISECSTETFDIGERPGGTLPTLVLGDRHDRPVPSAPPLPGRSPDPLPAWAPRCLEIPVPSRCPSVWHFAARRRVPECWFCPAWRDRSRQPPPWPLGIPGAPAYATQSYFTTRPTRRLDPYVVALIWAEPSRPHPYGRPRDQHFLFPDPSPHPSWGEGFGSFSLGSVVFSSLGAPLQSAGTRGTSSNRSARSSPRAERATGKLSPSSTNSTAT